MKKWEYKTIQKRVITSVELDYINDLGKEGWELVSAYHHNDDYNGVNRYHVFVFKREVEEEARSMITSVPGVGKIFMGNLNAEFWRPGDNACLWTALDRGSESQEMNTVICGVDEWRWLKEQDRDIDMDLTYVLLPNKNRSSGDGPVILDVL